MERIPIRRFPVEVPKRIQALPRDHRGYPVPFFVFRPKDWEEGNPIDFRLMKTVIPAEMFRRNVCWVCGQSLGRRKAFIGGPLSTAQRTYTDWPTHRECAEFSLKACPFLAIPNAQRREAQPSAEHRVIANMLSHNPEVSGLLIADSYRVLPGAILHAPEALEIVWYTRGRLATREEVETAIKHTSALEQIQNRPDILDRLYRLPIPE